MARPKTISIEFDGEVRSFRIGINEACEFEELTGKSIMGVFQELGSGDMKFTPIRALLYVGMKHADMRLTLEKVGDSMSMAEFASYTKTIIEAMTEFFKNIPTTTSSATVTDEKKN